LKKKRFIGRKYTENLSELEEIIQLPVEKSKFAENIYWVFGIVVSDKINVSNVIEVMNGLKDYGIGTRPFFWPLHKQPVLLRSKLIKLGHHPVAENISLKRFYIPSGLGINEEEINRVSEGVKEVILRLPLR